MSRSQQKHLYNAITILGIGVIFAFLFTIFQPFSNINLWLSDRLFIPDKPLRDIVIAGIDDRTLEIYGRLSDWPRNLHVKAIDNLAKDKAAVIGFDVLFIDNSPNDSEFAESIKKAGNVVLPVIGLDAARYGEKTSQFNHIAFPIESLKNSCKNVGHINITPDSDGITRRFPLIISNNDSQIFPSFTLAILATFFNTDLPTKYSTENNTLHLLGRNIPVENYSKLRVNFAGENGDRPYISYMDIIRGNYDSTMVKNKIVLIGITASGEVDSWAVPTSVSKLPGVFIHAAAIETIFKEQFLVSVDDGVILIIMLLLALLAAIVMPRIKLVPGGLFTISLIFVYVIAASFWFENGYILNLLYPILIMPIAYVSNVLGQTMIAQSEKDLVKNLFGRYVSPQVAREIITLADMNKLKLGGEQREVTILFADIRHFTQMSERMPPTEIVDVLNTYFSVIIDKVLQNGGTINKFAGDNIMAFWNAPQEQPDHALLAIKAACGCQKGIREIRDNKSQKGLQFGIGINTGYVVAGNIGSVGRMEYTVIGDAVNMASRICEDTPGDEIWIGDQTFNKTKANIEVISLEPRVFKGKQEKQIVYKVIDCWV
jgi:adenylate cyclase